MRPVKDGALFGILRRNLDEAASYPTHDDRVVEVQSPRIVCLDDSALNAAL
jgi:hypothetical protein